MLRHGLSLAALGIVGWRGLVHFRVRRSFWGRCGRRLNERAWLRGLSGRGRADADGVDGLPERFYPGPEQCNFLVAPSIRFCSIDAGDDASIRFTENEPPVVFRFLEE